MNKGEKGEEKGKRQAVSWAVDIQVCQQK